VLQGGMGRLFAGVTAFEMGNCAATLLILRATDLLEPGRGHDTAATAALWLYVLYNIAATMLSVPAGHLADRRSPRLVLTLGAVAFAVAYLGISTGTGSWFALTPWFVLAGIGIGCAETAQHAAVASSAPDQLRGSAFGLLAAIQSFGNFAASAAAGILWTAFSPTWAFAYLGAWMLIAIPLIAIHPTRAGTPKPG
jgi:MFS family permease